jgi:protein TonB
LQPGPATQPAPSAQTKADYGWLAQTIRTKVEQLKQYPHMARANRWEGRVVLRAVIGEDGQLVDLKIAESSGHSVLDEAALDVLKNAAPLTLPQPLGRSQVVVQVPISYRLR